MAGPEGSSPDWEGLASELQRSAHGLGMVVASRLASRLVAWMRTVLDVNREMNLTAIVDPHRFLVDHLLDSLAGSDLLPEGAAVLDVGSGAGFPGVPLAYARPDLSVTLLEASQRRARFLERSGLAVVHARAETFGRGDAGRDAFACVVSRAVAPLAAALEWTLPLVAPRGLVVLWRGRPQECEADAAVRVAGSLHAEVRGIRASPLPGRRFLLVDKVGPTPERFPRRPGVAARRPL